MVLRSYPCSRKSRNAVSTRKLHWTVRIAPVVGLVFLGPMYGGGALLIREVARRTGRGWRTMLTWALAYGMFEEAFLTQTLWNPNWAETRILDCGFVPALGTAPPWLLFMVGVHTVFSISVPIALMETLTRSRRTTPWLGKVGLGVVAGLFALVVVYSVVALAGSLAGTPQLVGAAVVIAALLVLGWFLGRPRAEARPLAAGDAPSPWLVGLFSLAAGAIFVLLYAVDPSGLSPWFAIPVPAWLSVLIYLALFAVVLVAMDRRSRRAGWADAHRLALAGGAVLTYAWHSFPWRTIAPSSLPVDLAGNAVCTAIAVTVLVIAAVRIRQEA